MSVKWTGNRSESGILRKSEYKEKKEELFVFGYSCKLFRDNEKALHIDQGKHLIPWMGDETLKIDRYDARGALHDLSSLEAPPGGFDWRVELKKTEWEVEQLCDEERYRALHTDEDEEEMYKEEELKRLHAAGYGQVGFNYEAQQEAALTPQSTEVDEPFLPAASFKALFTEEVLMPDSQKQNAIIEKTAKFIASQGAQMEILIKAKQGDNPHFKFLNKDSELHAYYAALIALVKAGKWPEKEVEIIEEKPPEPEEYLHPSLASATVIESAPSIPSIHYKPSADCDYTMLISKMRGETAVDETYAPELAPGEVAPPGTEPLPPRANAEISRPPVMYNKGQPIKEQSTQPQLNQYQQYPAYYQQYIAQAAQALVQPQPTLASPVVKKEISTGLSLMKNYNTDSETEDSDFDDSSSSDSKSSPIAVPPDDVQVVVDKMASYVARNGDDFAEIVRAKNDPRFTFLEPNNLYHPYYKRLMQQKRGIDVNGTREGKKKSSAPVSFSIKKMKEPDPILPKPALPYESSSDDESDKQEKGEEQKEKQEREEPKEKPLQVFQPPIIPPVVVYKIEQPTPKPIKEIVKPILIPEVKEFPKIKEPDVKSAPILVRAKSPTPDKKRESESPRREKRKHQDRKRESRTENEVRVSKRSERNVDMKESKRPERNVDLRESKRPERSVDVRESKRPERSIEVERRNEKDSERGKKRQKIKDELEGEIISLVDNPEELIDLTDDPSDVKGETSPAAGRALQVERRRRAAEFLRRVGVDPSAVSLPASSLASAMVDTLESLRKKKADEEEKRRKRDKRRYREKYDYENGGSHRKSKRRKYKSSDDNEEYDIDGNKKKKRKKDKKHSTKTKKKRRRETEVEEEIDLPLNIDLTSTLKELRNSSPTKELVQDIDESSQQILPKDSSVEEEVQKERRKKREEREYSEGEWSSDSDKDSASSSASRVEE